MSLTKRVMVTLALAGIERLGKESAANQVATNTFLLHDIADLLKPSITKIFVCGGFDGQPLSTVETFDISENKWSRGPDMKDPRQGHGMALVDDGRIFVIGGAGDNPAPLDSVLEFDTRRNSWKEVPPMKEKRMRHGTGVVDRRIFVFGGTDDPRQQHMVDTCEMFDVATGKWKMKVAPMPTARSEMGVAVIGHQIFAIGGWNRRDLLKAVEALDTETETWVTLPPMPTARRGMGVAVIDGRFIWTFGGSCTSGDSEVIEIFDASKSTWSKAPFGLTSPRFSPAAVAVGHKIYVIGGLRGGTALACADVVDTEEMTISRHSNLTIARFLHGAVGF